MWVICPGSGEKCEKGARLSYVPLDARARPCVKRMEDLSGIVGKWISFELVLAQGVVNMQRPTLRNYSSSEMGVC